LHCERSAEGDTGSVLIADLLPHYNSLLDVLDSQHGSKQMASATAASCLIGLCAFLRAQQSVFEGCVDYPAMLSSMDAAWTRYRRLKGVPADTAPLQAQGLPHASSSLTVEGVCSKHTTSKLLQSMLCKWAQACTASAGADTGSVLITDLLPHYTAEQTA
jgi:hypothetical protein